MKEVVSYSVRRALKMRFVKELVVAQPFFRHGGMFQGFKAGLGAGRSFPLVGPFQMMMPYSTSRALGLAKGQVICFSDSGSNSKKSGSNTKKPGSGSSTPPKNTSGPSPSSHGSQGQTPPEKFDGGDYDEETNDEYENNAERMTTIIRRLKKVMSTGVFVSVLAFVGYKRRAKRLEVADNIKDATFFKEESLFEGAVGTLCTYQKPGVNHAKVVIPVSILKDGTIKRIENLKINPSDVIVASFPKAGTTWVPGVWG